MKFKSQENNYEDGFNLMELIIVLILILIIRNQFL